MSPSANPLATPKATEDRLDEIRRTAADAAASGNGRGAPSHPQIRGRESYYGLPVLKAPVWTWEVALYFFIGGVSGMSAALALAAQLFGKDPALIRMALWVGFIGSAICPMLLIADLGRPSRFLNMLRVFKLQSPMSMGAWILVAFSGCVFMALAAHELVLHGYTLPLVIAIRWAGEITAAITGLLLAAYTGVLIGATANPVWSHHHRTISPHFLTSGLGGAGAILELCGFLIPATQWIGFAAATIEILLGIYFELGRARVNAPLHHGKSGWAFRIALLLSGPGALVLRLLSTSNPELRYAAAICFLTGAFITRYAWIWAGVASARDPEALFSIQRKA
jgi:formate-dependent nitrite reductase membrane component NrfD